MTEGEAGERALSCVRCESQEDVKWLRIVVDGENIIGGNLCHDCREVVIYKMWRPEDV